MPKNHLDVAERKFCELVAIGGLRETDAVRECWPGLTQNGVYKKVARLTQKVLVKSYLVECEKRSEAEIFRVRKRALNTAEKIATDPAYVPNRQFASIFGSLINATIRRDEKKDEDADKEIRVRLTLEEPSDEGSK